MSKSSLVMWVVSIVVGLFIVVSVLPFISGDEAGYSGKTAVVSTKPKVEPADEVAEAPETVSEEVADTAEVSAPVEQQVQQAVEQASAEVETMAEQVVEQVATEVEAVEQAVESTVEQASEQVTTAVAGLEQQASALVGQATDKVAEVAESVTEVAETAAAATGKVHIVTAQGLKYSPLVINVAIGDTVSWENMSSHDTQSMEGLIPAGAKAWHSAMGENYQHTFMVEGIYVYKCTPHFGAGMGGAVIVGNPVNLDEIKAIKVKGAAKRLVNKAIKAAEAM
jgi:pseudoazurin